MSVSDFSNSTRLSDLLADEAVFGLSPSELAELEQLLEVHGAAEEESYLRAAATLDIAIAGEESGASMPATLRQRVESDARRHLGVADDCARGATPESDGPAVIASIGWAPWLVAAASLVIAALAWLPIGQPPAPAAPSPSEQMQQMIAQGGDGVVRWTWQPLDDPTVEGGVRGEVVWSDQEQRGYMKFDGLAVNDPSQQQYQLWIFDAKRSEQYPVDGGVFDVTESGEVVVPITPKIAVFDASAFAVTVERPGGVVVSDRSRLALLAAPPQG